MNGQPKIKTAEIAPLHTPSPQRPVSQQRPGERKLLGFLASLRATGFRIGVGESRDALTLAVGAHSFERARFQAALRHLLCSSREDWVRFDAHFQAFYSQELESEPGDDTERTDGEEKGEAPSPKFQIVADFYHNEDAGLEGGAGRNAAVTSTDFRFLTDAAVAEEAARLAEQLAKNIRQRPTRRWRPRAKGKRMDMAAIARRLPGTDGDPLRLYHRERKRRPFHVVALLDVSHSMSYYSPMLAHFVRGLVQNFDNCEAFCFHMDLNRITDHMKERNLEVMRAKMEQLENLWFGGTNIGASIEAFNEGFLKKVCTPNTIVLLMSDGCDTSPAEEVARPLRHLRRDVRKVFWVNPLRERLLQMGLTSSSPLAASGSAIDAEVSGDSLRSLSRLARLLSN